MSDVVSICAPAITSFFILSPSYFFLSLSSDVLGPVVIGEPCSTKHMRRRIEKVRKKWKEDGEEEDEKEKSRPYTIS